MKKIVCSSLLQELKALIGEEAANDVVCGFLKASDEELLAFRKAAGLLLASRQEAEEDAERLVEATG